MKPRSEKPPQIFCEFSDVQKQREQLREITKFYTYVYGRHGKMCFFPNVFIAYASNLFEIDSKLKSEFPQYLMKLPNKTPSDLTYRSQNFSTVIMKKTFLIKTKI